MDYILFAISIFNFFGMVLISFLLGIGLAILPVHMYKTFKRLRSHMPVQQGDIELNLNRLTKIGNFISLEYENLEEQNYLSRIVSKMHLDN